MADDASSPPLQDVWYKLSILHAEWVNEKVGTRRKSCFLKKLHMYKLTNLIAIRKMSIFSFKNNPN